MKKNLFLVLLLCISYTSNCQLQHIAILIGKTDTDIKNYFDTLNNNQHLVPETSVTDYGDLLLDYILPLSAQKSYTCYSIITLFKRINGNEICIKQTIMGNLEFAQPNLSFIQDNFKFVSDGKWEMPYPLNPALKIVATFLSLHDKFPTYNITYEIQSNN
jgi:hypothetical protein